MAELATPYGLVRLAREPNPGFSTVSRFLRFASPTVNLKRKPRLFSSPWRFVRNGLSTTFTAKGKRVIRVIRVPPPPLPLLCIVT